jgi:hypothetical protein
MARKKTSSAPATPPLPEVFDPAGEANQHVAREKARVQKGVDWGKPRTHEPVLYLATCLLALERFEEAEQVAGWLAQLDPGAVKKKGDWHQASCAAGIVAWLLHGRGDVEGAARQVARIEGWGFFVPQTTLIEPDGPGSLTQARQSIAAQSDPRGERNWRVSLAHQLCWVIALRRGRGLPVAAYETELLANLSALRALLG